MKDPIEIFRSEIYDRLDNTVVITEVLTNGFDTQLIRICEPKWMYKGIPILYYGSSGFTVNKFNETIIFNGVEEKNIIEIGKPFEFSQGVQVGDVLEIKMPTLINGTRIAVKDEFKILTDYDVTQGVPLIWIHETIRGKMYDVNSPWEREVSYIVFLLNEIQHEIMTNAKRTMGVAPMYKLLSEISEIVRDKRLIWCDGDIDETSFSEFGTEDKNGIRKQILDANLGGLEIRFTGKVFKENCKC